MQSQSINKTEQPTGQHPNLRDYQHSYQNFDWQEARAQIKGYEGGINIAFEAVDRHVDEGHGGQP